MLGAALLWARSGDRAAPAAASAAGGVLPSPKAGRAAVEHVVAARNRVEAAERARFEADGWEMVETPEPEARVLAYDPALLDERREEELRVQLASTVPPRSAVPAIADAARRAQRPDVRVAAVTALGRIRAPEAQAALLDLLLEGGLDPRAPERRPISGLLRPADLDDPLAARLARALDDPRLDPAEREQIAFSLALCGLRDGTRLPDDVLGTLGQSSRALLDRMTALALSPPKGAHR